jgi:hypothetical protein
MAGLIAAVALCGAGIVLAAAPAPPDVIFFIMADDMGAYVCLCVCLAAGVGRAGWPGWGVEDRGGVWWAGPYVNMAFNLQWRDGGEAAAVLRSLWFGGRPPIVVSSYGRVQEVG